MKLSDLRKRLQHGPVTTRTPSPTGSRPPHTHPTPYGESGPAEWKDDGTHTHATATGPSGINGGGFFHGHTHKLFDGNWTGPPNGAINACAVCGAPGVLLRTDDVWFCDVHADKRDTFKRQRPDLCQCEGTAKLRRGEEPACCATCFKDVGYESGFPY